MSEIFKTAISVDTGRLQFLALFWFNFEQILFTTPGILWREKSIPVSSPKSYEYLTSSKTSVWLLLAVPFLMLTH